MLRKLGIRRAGLLPAAVAALLWVPGAWGQAKKQELPPFDVSAIPHTSNWIAWAVGFLFAVGCIAIAFKNPHRTHLD